MKINTWFESCRLGFQPNNNFLVQLLDKRCKFADIFVTKTGHSGYFNSTDFRPFKIAKNY